MWFGCGSHVLLDEPEKILGRSNQCCDQQEINDLRRKIEELQTMREHDLMHLVETEANAGLAEDLQKAERERDEAREALRDCVWWAECVSRRVTDRESMNWAGLQKAREVLERLTNPKL